METHVCSSNHSWALDNLFRRIVHNPDSILKDLVKPGFTVIDIGCGPGTFTISLAKYTGPEGKVIAVDLQEEMLLKVKQKAAKYSMEDCIKIHKSSETSLALKEKADFILAFYMVHEVPDQKKLFTEINDILKPDGTLLVAEPNFHVSENDFSNSIKIAESFGLRVIEQRKIAFSRSCLMGKK